MPFIEPIAGWLGSRSDLTGSGVRGVTARCRDGRRVASACGFVQVGGFAQRHGRGKSNQPAKADGPPQPSLSRVAARLIALLLATARLSLLVTRPQPLEFARLIWRQAGRFEAIYLDL